MEFKELLKTIGNELQTMTPDKMNKMIEFSKVNGDQADPIVRRDIGIFLVKSIEPDEKTKKIDKSKIHKAAEILGIAVHDKKEVKNDG